MTTIYQKTKGLQDTELHYCPGCAHGIVHKLIGEVLEEMGALGTAIGVCPVGCAVFAGNYFSFDTIEAAHGRAPAVATAVKRTHPTQPVFTYQGDGDLAAIGTAETVHACTRGENIVIIMINNGIYGMTGGQMSPCTLEGAKTATTPYGRRHDLNGTCYVTRQAVHTPAAVRKAKAALKKAFLNAKAKKGTSFVEVVATCSSGWKMTPEKANKWMEENMFAHYPLGDIKDTTAEPK